MKIIPNKQLAPLTNFKIGGKADFFVELKNKNDLFSFLSWSKKKMPIFILGGGTNILINDFSGIVVRPKFEHLIDLSGGLLKVGASVLVADLLNYVLEKGYGGLEWAGGLPGTVGGAIEGGVGCFGGEFKNLVREVFAVNLSSGEIRTFNQEECQFSYRDSFFRHNSSWLIIEAKLEFEQERDKELLRKIVEEKITYRYEKHPIDYPNAGSIFKNYSFAQAPRFVQELVLEKKVLKTDPFPVIPTAFLIAEAGLKGKKIGDAQISSKHSNFIINLGRATFNDVYQLIDFVKKTLADKFQIEVETEIRIIDDQKIL
jgi:UDP-N-acetylmuramate dehydrogenase